MNVTHIAHATKHENKKRRKQNKEKKPSTRLVFRILTEYTLALTHEF